MTARAIQQNDASIRYALIGCGKVGITWARHLAAIGGTPTGFASRSRSSARAAAEAAGGGRVFEDLADAVREADLVLVTTPDSDIETTGRVLADAQTLVPGSVVLHCSGALSSDILAVVRDCGAHVGSLHPLQSFAAPVLDRNPFAGIVMAGEGDPRAVALAANLATRLGARFIGLPTNTKTLYHAAAVVASNYLVALMGGACDMLGACGLSARDSFEVLRPLVQGTLDNIDRLGIPEALTGPIARGDVTTLQHHCRGLAAHRPELLRLYRVLGEYTLDLATARGGLSARQNEALRALLAGAAADFEPHDS